MESMAFDRTQEQEPDVDVAIVGYGPVGQALAALLGRAGHRVAVFERFKDIYRLPRAIHLDHRTAHVRSSASGAARCTTT
jgi:2-polyprenyl-6-methoxyphenol hydroxylase-like FAD-dependent oxidoreductase